MNNEFNFNEVFSHKIDYNMVNKEIEIRRNTSMNFLNNMINQIKQ